MFGSELGPSSQTQGNYYSIVRRTFHFYFTFPCLPIQYSATFLSPATMNLGCFSVSLAVKDIHVSKEFYERLGFTLYAGDVAQNWVILKNGIHNAGLFQGMFEKNMLTFNPGWDQNASPVDEFTDVRKLQAELKTRGVTMASEVEANTEGIGNCMIIDPDGNPILIDQHV